MKKTLSKLDHKARQVLLREWNQRIRHQPAATRLAWLESVTGLVAHGAKQRQRLVRDLLRLREKLERLACAEDWIEGVWDRGDPMPVAEFTRSRFEVRYGALLGPEDTPHPKRRGNSRPHRRLTPMSATDSQYTEDELDGLSFGDAKFYDRPPSPSAVAIRKIGHLKGRELSEEELRLRLLRRQERRAKLQNRQSMSITEIFDSINTEAAADALLAADKR